MPAAPPSLFLKGTAEKKFFFVALTFSALLTSGPGVYTVSSFMTKDTGFFYSTLMPPKTETTKADVGLNLSLWGLAQTWVLANSYCKPHYMVFL